MNAIDPNRLLQMRSSILAENVSLRKAAGRDGVAPAPAETGFTQSLTEALRATSEIQGKSQAVTAAYERGETNDLVGVMLERQKASLAFEATLQVRNKLLSAYRDIMNMPV